ncbi:MAG TPA: adenylate/guanylate cyclase domain-containing protein, partial [Coleofasciculaceae cyanobacterium]
IATARVALEMQQVIGRFKRENGRVFQLRIGLNTGPLVAGVIGIRKFIYDLWGDTVNIASRMESQGEAGKIQVTASTAELLGDRFFLEPRGPWQVRGRGEMLTYWLKGELPPLELETHSLVEMGDFDPMERNGHRPTPPAAAPPPPADSTRSGLDRPADPAP